MKAWIFIGLLLTMMSGAAYFYYSTTQSTIMQLTENNAILEENFKAANAANQQNVETIENLQNIYRRIEEDYNNLQAEFRDIRKQNDDLRERLGKHELDALAAAKPALVQRIVNNASSKALRCLELLSGAPLNEKEKNAKTPKEFNSECPNLYESLISR